jgi:hypothetical protein
MSLWATARYDLHLSDAEFYALTPREFDALVKRHKRRREHDEFMLAQLTAVVMNTGFRSREEPAQTRDYMPSQWRRKNTPVASPAQPVTQQSRAAVVQTLRTLFITGPHG